MNPLHSVIQFAFGCRHRHVSRVFTINKRTYKVCLDCGRELCYRMLTSRMHSSSPTSAPAQKKGQSRSRCMRSNNVLAVLQQFTVQNCSDRFGNTEYRVEAVAGRAWRSLGT
jgi:hypothetical protein